jgi:hypothetical protein
MKKNKSILLIGDSQLLPRYIGSEFINYYETFNYKLKKKFFNINFLEVVIGGANLSKLISQSAPYYGKSNPDLLIIFGSNIDAKIRGISEIEEKFFNLFPYGYLISKYLLHNKYLQNLRKINSIDHKTFSKQVKYITSIFSCSKIIYVGIYAGKNLDMYNMKFYENIRKLNLIIKKNLKKNDIFIDLQYKLNKNNCFMQDALHINKRGHNFLFNILNKRILKILK